MKTKLKIAIMIFYFILVVFSMYFLVRYIAQIVEYINYCGSISAVLEDDASSILFKSSLRYVFYHSLYIPCFVLNIIILFWKSPEIKCSYEEYKEQRKTKKSEKLQSKKKKLLEKIQQIEKGE